jgi:hypothetical protein
MSELLLQVLIVVAFDTPTRRRPLNIPQISSLCCSVATHMVFK